VRNGLLTYEELLELTTTYEARLGELYDRLSLPDEPDSEAAEALVVELQERFL
jgi:hypothetical protein